MPNKKYPFNILLIDDDVDDCCFFREALTRVSPRISLTCLQKADHFLKAIETYRPSLIFIDFKLPGKNGIDYVRQLKAHPVFNAIPVIMWSTSGMPDHVAAAYEAGVQLYLEKPWDIKVLVEELKKILQIIFPALLSAASPVIKKEVLPFFRIKSLSVY